MVSIQPKSPIEHQKRYASEPSLASIDESSVDSTSLPPATPGPILEGFSREQTVGVATVNPGLALPPPHSAQALQTTKIGAVVVVDGGRIPEPEVARSLADVVNFFNARYQDIGMDNNHLTAVVYPAPHANSAGVNETGRDHVAPEQWLQAIQDNVFLAEGAYVNSVGPHITQQEQDRLAATFTTALEDRIGPLHSVDRLPQQSFGIPQFQKTTLRLAFANTTVVLAIAGCMTD